MFTLLFEYPSLKALYAKLSLIRSSKASGLKRKRSLYLVRAENAFEKMLTESFQMG